MKGSPTTLRNAAAYIRVSTDDQIEYSPSAQIAEIRKFALREGFILMEEHIYMDEGISGKGTKKRDAFNLMIGRAKTKPKPFDVILVWKFSRFARSREDSVLYKAMLRRDCGIDVVSITEPLSDDKTSIILESVIEAMDEYYSINLAEETKRGMLEAARRGKNLTTAPYGYTVKDKGLVIEPEEEAVIKSVFERFAAGEGLFPIAKSLNDMGLKTHRGGMFENRTIEYILRNPVYIGKIHWNPTGRTRRDFTNPNILCYDGQHEAIISSELWENVQQRMAEVKARWKYHGRPTHELKEWPSGIVRCASCKQTLIFSAPHFYKCNGYVRGSCKYSQHTNVDVIKSAIISQLEEDVKIASEPCFSITYSQRRGGADLDRYKSMLKENERKASRLREAYLSGIENLEDYAQMKEVLSAEAENIMSQINDIEAQSQLEDTSAIVKNYIAKALAVLTDATSTKEEKHEAATTVIKNAFYDKSTNSLSIVYRIFLT